MSEPTTSESLFAALKAATGDLWHRAQGHPCVAALADGSLPREKFIHYLKQDYVYLIGYSRAIALATAKTPSLKLMAELAGLLHETLNVEMQLHRDYCTSFGINSAELEATEAGPICQAYLDFCVATAATGDVTELLCAVTPCGVGYAELGARHLPGVSGTDGHPYLQWFKTYGGAEYQQYARWMVTTLNELGADLPASRLPRLIELFRLGCRYEWLFWELAWGEDQWPV